MTTKPPSTVQPAPESALEHIAYAAVEGIPVADPHDRDRLGYTLWLWLRLRRDPLEAAVRSASARFEISEEEALTRIRERLTASGVTL
jgi:hypothetical protein